MSKRGIKGAIKALCAPLLLMLNGCSKSGLYLLEPEGTISRVTHHYFNLDVGIMLLIIIPTALLSVWAMWRYRKGGGGSYRPDWSHSWFIEAVVWGIPLITVGVLSYLSVKAIYKVNPYNPGALAHQEAAAGKPLEVDVIVTDWRWLFIYPGQRIASVNHLVLPVGVPVHFRLTSTSVVNDFIIPQLVGMIDVMPGMRTKQTLEASKTGHYVGFSADYSGAGLSWMNFETQTVTKAKFAQWVKKTQAAPHNMTDAAFNLFAKPYISIDHRPMVFGHVQSGLFDYVVHEVMSGKVWPTPTAMTENMVKYMNKQQANVKAGDY